MYLFIHRKKKQTVIHFLNETYKMVIKMGFFLVNNRKIINA